MPPPAAHSRILLPADLFRLLSLADSERYPHGHRMTLPAERCHSILPARSHLLPFLSVVEPPSRHLCAAPRNFPPCKFTSAPFAISKRTMFSWPFNDATFRAPPQ